MKKSTVLAVLFGITGILNAQDAVTHQFDSFKGKCTAATLDGSKVFETQAPVIVTAPEMRRGQSGKDLHPEWRVQSRRPGNRSLLRHHFL